MFLSSTDQSSPNNPSSPSSSSFLHLTNSSDELGHSHLSSFSIRDYAFSYRTKDLKKSWPFSSTSLQLCLKHGLSDPLTPVQPLAFVISPAEHSSEALVLKKSNISHVSVISYKSKLEKLSSNHMLAATKQGFENGLLASGLKYRIHVATVNMNPRKKCGLIVKPRTSVESGSKEDHSCLFAASESMALRTCPICKTFSSASSTTLNAHMDQCLSVDSVQQPIGKPKRPRFKPRIKVKSMIDIYAAAKGCTLDDLDKRNETKWAMISSYSNRISSDYNKPEVSNKGTKRSVLRVRIDEEVAGIGPVYTDAKSQKVRILSEFNEQTSDPSREYEYVSEGKANYKSFRTRLQGKKHYKHCKPVPQSSKRAVCKGNASEVPDYRRGYSEEGRGMERNQGLRRIFNQRMLTKCHLSRNGDQKATKNRGLRDQPSENGHSFSGDSLVVRGPSHVSTDLSEIVSSTLNSRNSMRIFRESQDFCRKKSTKSASFVANLLRCPLHVDQVFASEAEGVMKLKKTRLDFSENEEEDEKDLRELTDYDDNEETEKVLLSSSPLTSVEDNNYESYEKTGNSKAEVDMLDKSDDVDAEFESMIYEQIGFETADSFMEVDSIPIPGPPGSFLQSPWDMGTNAIYNHENSSAITRQVQSSQDQLDLTYRNSSVSPASATSYFAAPETQTFSLHNTITIDKRPSGFRDSDQSSCCQRKEKAFEDLQFGQPHDLLSKHVPAFPSKSNPVLRLMGKDLMVINQREEVSQSISQFLELSKSEQLPSSPHLPYGGNGLCFDSSRSFYNIP